jgi:hypothetical protein
MTMNSTKKASAHDPRVWPKPGDRVVRVITNRNGVRGVFQRIVLEVVGDLIIYTRKRRERPCKAHLIDWRKWCKEASVNLTPITW